MTQVALVHKDCALCKEIALDILNTGNSRSHCGDHERPLIIQNVTDGGAVDGQELLSGSKKDEGKARWDLLPFEVINAIADILTRGAKKYAERNWEKGISYGRVYAGVLRHLTEWWICKLFGRDGINHADGPNSHIDHAITGLMFLSAYEKRGMTAFDDRPKLEVK